MLARRLPYILSRARLSASTGATLVGLASLLGPACSSTTETEKRGPADLDGGLLPMHDSGHGELEAASDAAVAPDSGFDAGSVRQARVVDDPWCVAPSASTSYGFASWAAQIAAAGVGWVRSFDGSQTANALSTAAKNELSLSGIYWYSKSSPGTFPIDDLPGFRDYVSERLDATDGKILHWEVWNEPPNF